METLIRIRFISEIPILKPFQQAQKLPSYISEREKIVSKQCTKILVCGFDLKQFLSCFCWK